MDKRERNFGLIGYPIEHSWSASWFTSFFKEQGIAARYRSIPIPREEEISARLAQYKELDGFNVTIPYKEAIIDHLDELDETAAAIGAVNCVVIKEGVRKGYNTDAPAFLKTLEGVDIPGEAMILGTGGASRAVAYALDKRAVRWKKLSRKPQAGQWGYDQLHKESLSGFSLIVNTTPLGSLPLKDQAPPIPYASLPRGLMFYDLVYNPSETLFMQKGKIIQARVRNGWDMLVWQARFSWEIWSAYHPIV